MDLAASVVPVGVFTAAAVGIYAFTIRLLAAGTGTIRCGNQVLVATSGVPGSQGTLGLFYLDGGEVLTYEGPQAELFGVRLGNELWSE